MGRARPVMVLPLPGQVVLVGPSGEQAMGFVNVGNVNPVALTAAYTTQQSDFKVRFDCTAGALSVTLGTVAIGTMHVLQKIDSSGNALTIVGTVDGVANPTIAAQYGIKRIMFNGTTWESC